MGGFTAHGASPGARWGQRAPRLVWQEWTGRKPLRKIPRRSCTRHYMRAWFHRIIRPVPVDRSDSM
eukprot:6361001-Pyramimonas_sp.AAC.1